MNFNSTKDIRPAFSPPAMAALLGSCCAWGLPRQSPVGQFRSGHRHL